jgi:hypothetical protein
MMLVVADYPELRQLFGAYLNADEVTGPADTARALAAYRRDTGGAHRHAALLELVRLRGTTSSHAAFADALARLGCDLAFDEPAHAHALAEKIAAVLSDEAAPREPY